MAKALKSERVQLAMLRTWLTLMVMTFISLVPSVIRMIADLPIKVPTVLLGVVIIFVGQYIILGNRYES